MAAPSTRIQLCGRLVVEIDGERLEDRLPGRQGRLLLAYLALNRDRPVRRDELVAALWPEEDAPATADTLLRPALSRLRKAIGGDRVGGRSELALVLPDGAWIDWEAAHASLDATRAALSASEWRTAATEAAAAALIAGAGLLPGLEADWVDERRRELDDLRIEALEAVAVAGVHLGGSDLPAAERAARAAVEAAPFRESARAALMEALWAAGNVAEAMRVFDDIRITLREELGTAPGARLVQLHDQMLRGEEAPAPVAGEQPGTEAEPHGPDATGRELPGSGPPRPEAPPPGAPPPGAPAPAAADAPTPSPSLAPRSAGPIVERDDELTTVEHLLQQAAARQGCVAFIEGPAGIGKSRLLDETRKRAAAMDARVLAARGSEFERAFPFGAVRQLFEVELADPARRERILAGPAAPAAAVFAAPGQSQPGTGGDASFAALHGLFWLVVNMCADGPLMLAFDDLQWCDRPSLRFAAYLAQRLDGLPVLMAATVRTGEPSTDETLLGEIAQDPATVAIHPRPLTLAAVTDLVRDRLGEDADETFCATCHRTTVGNPLLLRQLLSALEADGVKPTAENAGIVAQIGPGAVSRSVVLRLGRLGPEAEAVAQAVAVLGENAHLPAIAAMSGLGEEQVAAAAGTLARNEILRPEPPVGFVHPLVRDAVYHELPLGERELQHTRAARMLADTHAAAEQVAAHLLAVPAHGANAWASDRLREAGREAMRKGAADSATTYFRRALEEEPAGRGAERAPLLFELGAAEGLTSGPAAAEHLRAAYDLIADPTERAPVAELLGRTLLFTSRPAEGAAIAREAAAALPPEEDDLRKRLEALELSAILFGAGDAADLRRLEPYREPPPPDAGLGAKMLAAVAALMWSYASGPADRCGELALAALAGGDLIRSDNGLLSNCAIFSVEMAAREEVGDAWDEALADAHRRGSLFAASSVHMWRGGSSYFRGELIEAEAMLRSALEEFELWGHGETPLLYARAFLCTTLLSRGDVEGAWEQVNTVADPGGTSDGRRWWLLAKGDLFYSQGRYADALAVSHELEHEFPWVSNPAINPWQGIRALSLFALGRREDAFAAGYGMVASSRKWGTPATVGPALRMLGTMKGEDGLPELREAVDVLDGALNRLQEAKAQLALGEALVRRGETHEGRLHLGRALELGEASGARPLVAATQAALSASGVHTTVVAPGGITSLTPSERRMALLAAEGRADSEIAAMLYLTPNAVGVQLAETFRKLGVSGREELEAVLEPV